MTSSAASPSSRRRRGSTSYIVSGDLDGLQLVDEHIRLFTTRMGVANTVIYDRAKVQERYGLRPDQMLDYKALKGDTSDNLPGVPGVGEKTAVALLQQFGTLDAMYERLDEVKGKLRERLDEHRAEAFMSREVGRIVTDLPAHARPRVGADRAVRPARPGPALPGARVPVPDRPAAAHDRQSRRPGGRRRRRAPAVARSPRRDRMRWRAAAGAVAVPVDMPDRSERRGPAQCRSRSRRARSSTSTRAPWATRRICWSWRRGWQPMERTWASARRRWWPALQPRAAWHRHGRPRRELVVPALDDDATQLPRWFARADRPLIGHDLKPLWTMLLRRGIELPRAGVRHRGRFVHAQRGAPGPVRGRPGRAAIRGRAAAPGGIRGERRRGGHPRPSSGG